MIALFAEAPALPLHTAGPYVAAAYIVFVLIMLIYVGIMARRLTRNQRELAQLRRQIEERERQTTEHELDDPGAAAFFPNENDNEIHSHIGVAGERSGGVDVDVADLGEGATNE